MKPYIYLQTQKWDPVSMGIRFATRSVLSNGDIGPSHAGFLHDGVYLSAQGDGVKQRHRDPNSIIWVIDAPGVGMAYEWALTQIGKPYDYSAILGIMFNRTSWRDDDRWFCSELVARGMEMANWPLFNLNTPVYRITPRDLMLPLGEKIIGMYLPHQAVLLPAA